MKETKPDQAASAPKPPVPEPKAPGPSEAARSGAGDGAPYPRPHPVPSRTRSSVASDAATSGVHKMPLPQNAPQSQPTPLQSAAPKPQSAPPHPAPSQPAPHAPLAAVPPPVRATYARFRHLVLLVSLAVWVGLPVFVSAWYLWTNAADQYASKVGFSVRREEIGSAVEILGGITNLSGSSSSDTDILYEFIQSQGLVQEIDSEIDLRAIWSKPQSDPVFAFEPSQPLEDLVDYWLRMVRVSYDSGSGLIEVEARAFAPEDATLIATRLFEKSALMINELSAIAREDAIRYSRDELAATLEQLKNAREIVTRFRNEKQLIDPSLDLQSQAGLLGTLQAQLAAALIELDLLTTTTNQNDPRLAQAQRRVVVIEERIAAERQKLGLGGQGGQGEVFADLVGEYERLVVDREFAERAYTSARAAYDTAVAEARRTSRYLAAYIAPTRAESPRYPERVTLLALITLFLFLIWSIVTMVIYSLRDRR